MKYAILSDSHDNIHNLSRAIEIIKKEGITQAIHLGDFCTQSTFKFLIQETQGINLNCISGNMDVGIDLPLSLELETERGKIFIVHRPEPAERAAESGNYVAVFHGHTHLKRNEVLPNGTLLANPGELAGSHTGQPSFAVWNSETNEFKIINPNDFKVGK